jgi:putative transposase
MIVSDNGTEYTSNAILGWADETGVGWHYIAPGKPQQDGYNERVASPAFGSTVGCATSC